MRVELPRHQVLEEARRRAAIPIEDLWLRYFSLGGRASPLELEAFLRGALHPEAAEYNMIAHALNEHYMLRGENHPVPYAEAPHEAERA